LSIEPEDEDEIFINSRLTEAAVVLGFIYFSWHILRPEDIFPDGNDWAGLIGRNMPNDVEDLTFSKIFTRTYENLMNRLKTSNRLIYYPVIH
jgi:hypothetical protein